MVDSSWSSRHWSAPRCSPSRSSAGSSRIRSLTSGSMAGLGVAVGLLLLFLLYFDWFLQRMRPVAVAALLVQACRRALEDWTEEASRPVSRSAASSWRRSQVPGQPLSSRRPRRRLRPTSRPPKSGSRRRYPRPSVASRCGSRWQRAPVKEQGKSLDDLSAALAFTASGAALAGIRIVGGDAAPLRGRLP